MKSSVNSRGGYHSRRSWWIVVSLSLLFFCVESVQCRSNKADLVRGHRYSGKQRSSPRVRRKSYVRGLQDDKEDDKNNDKEDDKNNDKEDDKNNDKEDDKNNDKNATPAPSQSPSQNPTPLPTREPTRQPTLQPTTSEPTQVPFVLSPEESLFSIQFSLIRRDEQLKATDVIFGNEPALTESVFDALLFVVCAETDLVMVAEHEIDAPDMCKTSVMDGKTRQGGQERRGQSIVSNQAPYVVTDGSSGNVEWTDWKASFRVLQAGYTYTHGAATQLELDATVREIQELAIELMGDSVQAVLNTNIREETFDDLIDDQVETSVVGEELETFIGSGQTSQQNADPIDPEPLHGLRVAGVALFVFNTVMLIVVIKLSARRRQSLEKEAAVLADNPGCLNTEAALESMLDQARVKPEKTSGDPTPPSSDEGDLPARHLLDEPKANPTPPESPQLLIAPISPLTPEGGRSTPRSAEANTAQATDSSFSLGIPSLLGPFQGEDSMNLLDCDSSASISIPDILPDWMVSSTTSTPQDPDNNSVNIASIGSVSTQDPKE